MILFKSQHSQIFNKLIHNCLGFSIYDSIIDIGDAIDEILPKYLRREQFIKCKEAFDDLYTWSSDKFDHELTVFHQLALYKFMEYAVDQYGDDFKIIGFDKKLLKKINEFVAFECKKVGKKYSKAMENKFYNIKWLLENMFTNTDFLLIESLYINGSLDKYLKQNMHIANLYWDILPVEFQKKYEPINVNIDSEMKSLIEFMQRSIDLGNLSFMFWKNGKPMDESHIQIVLENIFDSYFYNREIDITRESVVGRGKIDFKFYKSKKEKTLFEIKKACTSYLKHGYEKQIIDYMNSIHCNKAYYIIFCFTDDEIKKVQHFIDNLNKNKTFNEFINIVVLDVRIKNKNFYQVNRLVINSEIPESVDQSFNYINSISNLSTRDSLINYVDNLLKNYDKLDDEKLKDEYIKRLNEMCFRSFDFIHARNHLFDKSEFYKIINENALRNFVLTLFSNLTIKKDFNKTVSSIKCFLNDITDEYENSLVAESDIKEVFNFIKHEKKYLYELLTKIDINIYLFKNAENNFNSLFVPSHDFNRFDLLCFCIKKDSCEDFLVTPILYFVHKIGLIICTLITKEYMKVPKSFIKFMEKHSPDKNFDILFFAYLFAVYLLNDTKYEKTLLFNNFSNSFYESINTYFDKEIMNLLDESER